MRQKNKGFTISELIFVLVIVVVVVLVMLPVIRYSRCNMEKTTCSNNLQQIGLALYIYAQEHDSQFPGSIKTLYDEEYLSDTGLLDCPATKHIGNINDMDYLYTAGMSIKNSSSEPLLRDKSNNHAGGVKNILYVNGKIDQKGD